MIETLIGLLGGAAAAGAIYLAKKFGATLFVNKWGAVIEKAYAVIDPVAGQLMSNYSGSEVQQAIQLAVARVADNNLDEADIVEITNYVIAKFNPELAASKVLDIESEEGKAALALLDEVKRLHDGVSFDELLAIAKAAKALI
jgi:hypothetical protein